MTQHRFFLSERLGIQLDSTVAYGPFHGLRLEAAPWWSGADRGAMLLGLYEPQVLRVLESLAERYSLFVDIGAADGYYGVGMAYSGLCARSVCFESDERGQEAIKDLAIANGVPSRVTVRGQATSQFLNEIGNDKWKADRGALFLIDIEGGEYELLTDEVLRTLAYSSVIVELHEASMESTGLNSRLIERARQHFNVEILQGGPKDPASIAELRGWNDDDRWILCSESRQFAMSWLLLTPTRDRTVTG